MLRPNEHKVHASSGLESWVGGVDAGHISGKGANAPVLTKVLWDVSHPLMLHKLSRKILLHGLLFHCLMLLCGRPCTVSLPLFFPVCAFRLLLLQAGCPMRRRVAY